MMMMDECTVRLNWREEYGKLIAMATLNAVCVCVRESVLLLLFTLILNEDFAMQCDM